MREPRLPRRQLLEEASPKTRRTRWHRRFANNLLKVWPALWTFTEIDGIQPTNNPAERALSAAGTCRLQRRSLFTYLSELITTHNRGDPFPALAA